MEMTKGPVWGRKEVEVMLEELKERGEYQTRQEILRTIKAQEPELVQLEAQMINTTFMLVTMTVGILAKLLTQRFLERTFAQ